MNISDWLTIVETVILLITAIIILYYTLETKKIREETSKQNSILAEQLRIQLETHEFEKRDRSFIEPIFRFESSYGGKYNFTNKGSMVKIIKIEPEGNFRVQIFPKDLITNEEKGYIKLDLPTPRKGNYKFTLQYENKIGEKKLKRFYFDSSDGKIKEES